MYKQLFSMGRAAKKKGESVEVPKKKLLFTIDEVCDSSEYSFMSNVVCAFANLPESAPAIFLKGKFYKIDEMLNKYPETSQSKMRSAVVRVVESAVGVEPLSVGNGLLFASTKPATLELMFAFAHIYYESDGNGQYVRRASKWWRRRYVKLEPLDPGLVNYLSQLLKECPTCTTTSSLPMS